MFPETSILESQEKELGVYIHLASFESTSGPPSSYVHEGSPVSPKGNMVRFLSVLHHPSNHTLMTQIVPRF